MRQWQTRHSRKASVREHCCAPLGRRQGKSLMRLYVAVPGSSQSDQCVTVDRLERGRRLSRRSGEHRSRFRRPTGVANHSDLAGSGAQQATASTAFGLD